MDIPIISMSFDSDPTRIYPIVGIIVAICGNILISVALNIQRYAHVRLDRERWRNDRRTSSSSFIGDGIWWLGIIIMTIGETGNFLAYGIAPPSVVSPLGVFALVSNCIIAPVFFNEKLKKWDIVGVGTSVIGILLVILSVQQGDDTVVTDPLDDIHDALDQVSFRIYLVVTIGLLVLLMNLLLIRGRTDEGNDRLIDGSRDGVEGGDGYSEENAVDEGFDDGFEVGNSDIRIGGGDDDGDGDGTAIGSSQEYIANNEHNFTTLPHIINSEHRDYGNTQHIYHEEHVDNTLQIDDNHQPSLSSSISTSNYTSSSLKSKKLFTLFGNISCVALLGAYTALSTKCLSSLLRYNLPRALTLSTTYILLFIIILTASLQVLFLNRALRHFPSTLVIPVHFVFFTISVIVGSEIVFHDFDDDYDFKHSLMFITGCILTFIGVWFIASGTNSNIYSSSTSIRDLIDNDVDVATTIAPMDEEIDPLLGNGNFERIAIGESELSDMYSSSHSKSYLYSQSSYAHGNPPGNPNLPLHVHSHSQSQSESQSQSQPHLHPHNNFPTHLHSHSHGHPYRNMSHSWNSSRDSISFALTSPGVSIGQQILHSKRSSTGLLDSYEGTSPQENNNSNSKQQAND